MGLDEYCPTCSARSWPDRAELLRCCLLRFLCSIRIHGLNAAAEALTSPRFLVTTWIGSEGDRSIVEIEKKQTVGTCFFPRIYSTIVEVVNKQPWPGDD